MADNVTNDTKLQASDPVANNVVIDNARFRASDFNNLDNMNIDGMVNDAGGNYADMVTVNGKELNIQDVLNDDLDDKDFLGVGELDTDHTSLEKLAKFNEHLNDPRRQEDLLKRLAVKTGSDEYKKNISPAEKLSAVQARVKNILAQAQDAKFNQASKEVGKNSFGQSLTVHIDDKDPNKALYDKIGTLPNSHSFANNDMTVEDVSMVLTHIDQPSLKIPGLHDLSPAEQDIVKKNLPNHVIETTKDKYHLLGMISKLANSPDAMKAAGLDPVAGKALFSGLHSISADPEKDVLSDKSFTTVSAADIHKLKESLDDKNPDQAAEKKWLTYIEAHLDGKSYVNDEKEYALFKQQNPQLGLAGWQKKPIEESHFAQSLSISSNVSINFGGKAMMSYCMPTQHDSNAKNITNLNNGLSGNYDMVPQNEQNHQVAANSAFFSNYTKEATDNKVVADAQLARQVTTIHNVK